MTVINTKDPQVVIAEIRSRTHVPPSPEFSASRWPHTYAYDYMREHREVIEEMTGISYLREDRGPYWSRADAAGVSNQWVADLGWKDKSDLLHALAVAYCVDNDIAIPEEFQ